MSGLTQLLLDSEGQRDQQGYAESGLSGSRLNDFMPRARAGASSSSGAQKPEAFAAEEEDSGGLPVVSASKLQSRPGRPLQQRPQAPVSSPARGSSEAVPSLREMLSNLDAVDGQNSEGEVVDLGHAEPAAVRQPSPARGSKLAEAAQLHPDAPSWSFMKAKIAGAAEVEVASRTKTFEDNFEEVENSALRAPARQNVPRKNGRQESQIERQPQTVRMMLDQNYQDPNAAENRWDGWDDWEQWEWEEQMGFPRTGPRLMASQLGVDKSRGRGRGKGKGRGSLMQGEKRVEVLPQGQRQHSAWDGQLPWEEPMPWESGPQRLQQVREQLLPQPRPGRDPAERNAWQMPASSSSRNEKPVSTTEALPGTRGLRKPGAAPALRRGTERKVPSITGSPLEYAPLKCGRCLETTYCTVDCSRLDCWAVF